MSSKIREIRETASDAVEIVRGIGTPEFRDSLEQVRETTVQVREIITLLQTNEMQENIANIKSVAESFQSAANAFENASRQLKSSGVGEGFTSVSKVVADVIEITKVLKNNKQAMTELGETLQSLRELFDEIRITIKDSRQTGIVHDFKDTVKNVTDAIPMGVRRP